MISSSIRSKLGKTQVQYMLMVFSVSTSILMLSSFALFADITVGKNNGDGIFAFAQTNQLESKVSPSVSTNNTFAIATDEPITLLVNRTTVPLNLINLTVKQFTSPVDMNLKPIGEIGDIRQEQQLNLSSIDTQILLEPTGEATTTTYNRTVIPFNQTIVTTQAEIGQ